MGAYCNYWTSSLREDRPYGAWYVHFASNDVYWGSYNRSLGQSVRPVYPKE